MYDEEIVRKNVLKCSDRSTHFLCTYHASLFKSGGKSRDRNRFCNYGGFAKRVNSLLFEFIFVQPTNSHYINKVKTELQQFRCFFNDNFTMPSVFQMFPRIIYLRPYKLEVHMLFIVLFTQLLAPQSTTIHSVTWPGEHMQIVQKF